MVVGMLKTYRSLLSIPHARAFVLAGFVARLSISMRALGAVLMVSELTGSYGLLPASVGWWTARGSGGRCSCPSRCTLQGRSPS